MAGILLGQRGWELNRDAEGHREYTISFFIRSLVSDGPAAVLLTPGLPRPGSPWRFGSDVDTAAYCSNQAKVTPTLTNEPNRHWTVELKFTTKPFCEEYDVKNPLLMPYKISGTYTKNKEEAYADRFGRPVVSSSWEQLKGPQIEFDVSLPQIVIEQNFARLNLTLLNAMRDCVNDRPLWGLPRRTVKLSDIAWERLYHNRCFAYYKRKLTFEVNYDTWDRDLLDEGTKVLHGRWAQDGSWELLNINGEEPNRFDPRHFDRFKDRNGENCRVILREGVPAGVLTGREQAYVFMKPENDPFAINIPLTDPKWVPLIGDWRNPEQWKPTIKQAGNGFETSLLLTSQVNTPAAMANTSPVYVRGQVVTDIRGVLCVCKKNVPFNRNWRLSSNTSVTYAAWQFWYNGQVFPGDGDYYRYWTNEDEDGNVVLTERGYWDAATEYESGDVVLDPTDTRPGIIHLEKYKEANFTLLGIPLTL